MKRPLVGLHFLFFNFFALFLLGCGGTNSSNIGGQASSDTQKPKITLTGAKTVYLNINEAFNDPGATAIDDVDGLLPSNLITKTSTLNVTIAGSYTITYRVADKAGNVDTAKRTVHVIETLAKGISKPGLHINEVLVGNTHTNYDSRTKQFDGWVELFNNSNRSINLRGYSLSDGKNNWDFPSQSIRAGDYILVWMDKGSGLHTGFNLDMDGESISLLAGSTIIDNITFPKQKADVSFTYYDDKLYYMTPTPNKRNELATSLLKRSNKPSFSLKSGFYQGTQQITLTTTNDAKIYFTKDGSIPTIDSTTYSNPIPISSNTIIRTIAVSENLFPSSPKSRTYFINEKDISLPVLSIGINDEYLHSNSIGIYVVGNDSANPNYKEDWIRAASMEYIKDNKSQFNENIGLKIHGAGSRTFEQKSFTVYAKDKFGAKSINYQLFSDKNIKKFKTFLLRNAGGDHHKTMMRDALNQSIVKDALNVDYQAYQPSVVFVNGEYWGIFNIRETTNDDYLEANHHVDPKNTDILYNDNIELKGNDNAYTSIQGILENSNSSYSQVAQVLDIPAYIDYLISEMYVGNEDWPGRNRKYWRERKSGAKWRYFLYDLDLTMQNIRHNTLRFALGEASGSGNYNRPFATAMIKKLIANPQFRNEFASKFTTCLNTIFLPSSVNKVITSVKSAIESEIPRHFTRWQPKDNTPWADRVQDYYDYYRDRNSIMRGYLYARLGLSGNHTLNISTATNGTITIDDIALTSNFSGNYFTNAKVQLSTLPKDGYQFKQWRINGQANTNPNIKLTLNRTINVLAEFELYDGPSILINEINFKSAKDVDSGDWVEIVNNSNSTVNLTGWKVSDGDGYSYTFPNNTVLASNDYLIIAEDTDAFHTQHPNINILGDLPFGISSKGDTIKLINNANTLVDIVTFDESWTNAASKGSTLSLINPNSDNSQKNNWDIATKPGTPHASN